MKDNLDKITLKELNRQFKYNDLREFLDFLEQQGELKRIKYPISTYLEMTEISDRTLRANGPALLFENVILNDGSPSNIPVLCNLFGTHKRVALGMGCTDVSELRAVGEFLAYLKQPTPPSGLKDFFAKIPSLKQIFNMPSKKVKNAPCQEVIITDTAIDLSQFPIMHCWSEDIAPLVTWGLTITRGVKQKRQNLGIYRQQYLAKNKLIMRWLSHRGGALDFKEFCDKNPGKKFPVCVAIGADPAMILSAVTPIPDSLSEYAFAGLLRGAKTVTTKAISCDLDVPANAEIVLEGYIDPNEKALEGPYGDHTGYYNEQEYFPVFTITHITQRKNPIYMSTHTGRPPDEPAVLGEALNEVFVPLLKAQFPEIIDFYLPPEGCSYRLAVVSINKQYPGHAKRVMFGIWSFLRQFMYTKFIIVVDHDINIKNWHDIIWAITTRMDPIRDTTMVDHTPIDYLDFASPVAGLGSKMGLDATNKWAGETQREWGTPIVKNEAVTSKIDQIWDELDILNKR